MNYHDITTNDMKNGDGLRVVLWVSGCNHHCHNCQNPITWDPKIGLPFTRETYSELLHKLNVSYINGLTLSGGDPLYPGNRETIFNIVKDIKNIFNDSKTIWLYTGYTWEDIISDVTANVILQYIDVLVDGPFYESLKDNTYPWAGSTNQRVIDVKESLKRKEVVLHESH